ncbi:hypothetical protein CB1_000046001 [Camelus ferus]|nr:hypothetical protein CB1_000046001 [Camelus ferus]
MSEGHQSRTRIVRVSTQYRWQEEIPMTCRAAKDVGFCRKQKLGQGPSRALQTCRAAKDVGFCRKQKLGQGPSRALQSGLWKRLLAASLLNGFMKATQGQGSVLQEAEFSIAASGMEMIDLGNRGENGSYSPCPASGFLGCGRKAFWFGCRIKNYHRFIALVEDEFIHQFIALVEDEFIQQRLKSVQSAIAYQH